MSRLLEPPPGIVEAITRYECPRCGNNCSCGIPYVAKTERAADAIKANPGKSNRAIAEEIGVSDMTVGRARARATDVAPEERTGRDGKSYPAARPRRRVTIEPDPVVAAIEQIITLFEELDHHHGGEVLDRLDQIWRNEDDGAEGS